MRIYRMLVPAVLLLLGAGVCLADDQDPCAAQSSASDVQFSLALKGGQSVFHEGEIIPLQLMFSTASGRYWFNNAGYDRSGRLDIDAYCVDPQGSDPLASYFNNGVFFGGGLFSEGRLAEKPFIRDADLNEWHRLPPGRYRLYAVSHRVFRPAESGEKSETGHIPVVLRSNTVEFQVQPADAAWQKQQVHDAVAMVTSSAKTDDQQHAVRVLRFLGTRESTAALARVFNGDTRQPGQFDMMLGLFSSPYPDVALKAMRAEFAVPSHAIDAMFLHTVVQLQIDSDPAWNPRSDAPVTADSWNRREERYKELMRTEVADLASVVSRKTGTARAITLNAMLREVSDDYSLVASIRPVLISAWKDLPRETQQEMITYFWSALDTPEMLPVLRSILAEEPPPGRTTAGDMRNAALKHVYEFDPAEGRALIARDLANPKANPNLESVRLLAPEQVQVAIPAAVERIRNSSPRMVDFELIDRYGDASILASIQAVSEPDIGKQACDPQAHLLRYFLRVAPDYGAQQVRGALAARKDTGCYRSLLQDLGDQLPHAQQSAIDALDDPDPEVEQDAVIALTNWGTAEAEDPLWARLQRFHDEWAGRAADLERTPDCQSEGSRAVGFEQALAQGIARGRGWICPPEKLERLAKLVLTDSDRRQLEGWAGQWSGSNFQISSGWYPADAPTFQLMSYSGLTEDQLSAKLAQFPRGSRFNWLIWLPGQIQPPTPVSRQEAAFERVRSDAESHGVAVIKQSQP